MTTRFTGLIAALALVSIVAVPTLSAGQAAPAPAQQAPAAQTASGELVSVDVTAKSLVIKPASGANMTFSFTDETKITGAQNPAGLATMCGSQATVRYTARDKVLTATEIQIAAAKK